MTPYLLLTIKSDKFGWESKDILISSRSENILFVLVRENRKTWENVWENLSRYTFYLFLLGFQVTKTLNMILESEVSFRNQKGHSGSYFVKSKASQMKMAQTTVLKVFLLVIPPRPSAWLNFLLTRKSNSWHFSISFANSIQTLFVFFWWRKKSKLLEKTQWTNMVFKLQENFVVMQHC